MEDKYQICTNCVMDTTDSKIVFDENGVCDHCNTFNKDIKPFWNQRDGDKLKLNNIVNKIKEWGKGKEYDCLLGMSGGIDSSYLLYYAVEKLGLRPLVFHIDTGWNTDLSIYNVHTLVEKLGVKLHTVVIDWKEMADLQLAFFKSGVPHIDTPQDHACFATMYQFASKYNIPYILTGGNYSTECIRNPKEWMYYQSDVRQLKDIHKKFGTKPLKKFPLTNILWHKFYLPYIKGVRLIRMLDLIPYNKDEAIHTLEEKFGYQKYPQKHFEDFFTKWYESYWLYERFGYDVRRVQLSSLILTNQISREAALSILATKPYDVSSIDKDTTYIAEKLGVSYQEIMSYMALDKKTYKDYKSQQSIYNIGTSISRLLGIEKGGKR